MAIAVLLFGVVFFTKFGSYCVLPHTARRY